MYLFIRMLALIDTGKYLTSIYMVYLYLMQQRCSYAVSHAAGIAFHLTRFD